MNADFVSFAHGKWILAGEHAVCRGHPALVFPVPHKQITLQFWHTEQDLDVDFQGPYREPLLLVFWGLLEESLKRINRSVSDLNGKILLENTIPTGMGLGFSAALCVVVTRLLIWKGWLDADHFFEFAKTLEDYFHGRSSGIDVAGTMSDCGLLYRLDAPSESIEVNWLPKLYLSFSDRLSITASCIDTVNALWQENRTFAAKIDGQMDESVQLALWALIDNPKQGQARLKQSMDQSLDCFKQWGLVNGELKSHIDQLMSLGAIAAKPTGAGDGGFVLSLWKTTPPECEIEWIPAIS